VDERKINARKTLLAVLETVFKGDASSFHSVCDSFEKSSVGVCCEPWLFDIACLRLAVGNTLVFPVVNKFNNIMLS